MLFALADEPINKVGLTLHFFVNRWARKAGFPTP